MAAIDTKLLSDLIGEIYDCALDPSRWPKTMGVICSATGCTSSILQFVDLKTSEHHFFAEWNVRLETKATFLEKFTHPSADMYRGALTRGGSAIDEPMTSSRSFGGDPEVFIQGFRQSPMYLEWAKP